MPLNQTLRKDSNVLWTISIIQDQKPEAQTKSEFAEMANDVLTTNNINRVTLCLADNLQRYRLMIEHGMSEEEAIAECQKMAHQWHQDNAVELEKLKSAKKLSFLTWEEFLGCPDRIETIKSLENWYKTDRKFRNDVDGRIRQVLQSTSTDAKISDKNKQTELLMKYLFEECAYQKFSASKGFNYEIYKTPTSKFMRRVKYNTQYVPPGVMVELYFTQFAPTEKNNTNNNVILSEKESFSPVFSKPSIKNYVDIPIPIKIAQFMEKTIQMLPPKEQEKAFDAIIKFTTQEILPLCYINNSGVLNI